jgi:hypothetical protein
MALRAVTIGCAILVATGCGSRSELFAVNSGDAGTPAESGGPPGSSGGADSGSDSAGIDAAPPGIDAAPVGIDAAPACVPPTGLVTLASGQHPNSIAVDRTSVYWTSYSGTNSADGLLLKVSRCGGPITTLASAPDPTGVVAVDARNVYWLGNDNSGAHLLSVPIGGGQVTTLASPDSFIRLAIDDVNAYWTAAPLGNLYEGTVMRAPLAGGAPTTLASAQPFAWAITVAAGNVYWATEGSTGSTGQVFGEPTGGGPPTVIGGQANGLEMAANSTDIFWSAVGTGNGLAIMTAPLGGGTAKTLVEAADAGTPVGDAFWVVDDASLYFSFSEEQGQQLVYRVLKQPLNGAPAVTVASGVSGRMAVDATSLYFADDSGPDSGRIMVLTPK